MKAPSPKAFVSHASEDKNRFVLPFATQLRANGIDAWVDRWEMHGGDSLVTRIFDEGIGQAAAIIIVVSAVSVVKPWVREELDAAVVQRIQKATRLIPVILDNATPPVAIAHLLHYNVEQLGLDETVQQVLRTMYGVNNRPPLGHPPAFATSPSVRPITGDRVDDLVLYETLQAVRDMTTMTEMFDDEIREKVTAQGVSLDGYHESLEALIADYSIKATPMAGRQRFLIQGVADRIWLDDEAARGLDYETHRRAVLATVVNGPMPNDWNDFAGVHWRTNRIILNDFERDGLLTVMGFGDGGTRVTHVGPLAARALRQMN